MNMYHSLKTKKDKQSYIKNMVSTNQDWAIRALLRIFNNQTEDEQCIGHTKENNGIGFSGADSDILTSFAKQVLSGRQLSQKQMSIVYKRMPRYSRQLMNAAEGN